MSHRQRGILLVQLPIPPVGPEPIRGNVPLAAGYLKLLARLRGLESHYEIEILPTAAANTASDRGLVEAILARGPSLVGFTCYLWNIDRAARASQGGEAAGRRGAARTARVGRNRLDRRSGRVRHARLAWRGGGRP